MTYDEVVSHLDALQMHKIKLGLEAMQSFLEKVGRPESTLKFVHIAGTNGKGSVCAALSSVLGRAGYRVGVYTSPHLSSVRERFRIGNEYITEDSFARLGTKICQILGTDQITYFEFTTALGLLWFAESEVDIVLLETGLGGRLDATNVVTPLVSVITSVSMDHEAYLGNTLGEIAGEKAGIVKSGVPVVSSAIHAEVAPVVENAASKLKAQLYSLGNDFNYSVKDDNTWAWLGRDTLQNVEIGALKCSRSSVIQQENDAVAITVLLLLRQHNFITNESQIRSGLADVSWPGRMEYFEQYYVAARENTQGIKNGEKNLSYLLDGAHNLAGVQNMSKTLAERFTYKKAIGIWGAMSDKDLSGTLGSIMPLLDTVILTQPDGERSATPESIYTLLTKEQQSRARCVATVEEALRSAQDIATEGDIIVIGGSLYLIGAMRYLLLGDLV